MSKSYGEIHCLFVSLKHASYKHASYMYNTCSFLILMTVAELSDDITYDMWHLIQLYIQMKVYLNCPETV